MQSARRKLGTQLLMLLVVLTGLYFGYSFAREAVQAQRLASEADTGRAANDQLAAENRKLERDLQYYQSDAYAELRARTDLNMRLKDETIILPVFPPTDTAHLADGAAPPAAAVESLLPPDAAAPATASAAPPPGGRPWDRWLSFFTTPQH